MYVIDALNNLYKGIRECHICPKMDMEKEVRLIEAINPESDVFIISQTLAADQVRLTGVSFFNMQGSLGKAGRNLEKFLNKFNRTVHPHKEVKLSNNVVIPSKSDYLSVYNSDIALCYPGKRDKGRGDRKPTRDEICNCINQGFLIKEIELIKPKLLILMGRLSRDNFFEYILKAPFPNSLSGHIAEIVQNKKIPNFCLGNQNMYVLPIHHSSGANPRFISMLENDKLIELIKDVLK